MVVLNSRDRKEKLWLSISTLLTTILKQAFAENTNSLHSHCSNNSVTLLNTANSIYNKFLKN